MRDFITYSPDTTSLLAEVAEKFPDRLSEDGQSYNVTKIPTHRNGIETLSLVRCVNQDEADELASLTGLQIIGECVGGAYQFNDADAQATYERVRGSLTVEFEGETHTLPYMIGVFA
jgi:hypothetical protein